jgi:hypothetical protein
MSTYVRIPKENFASHKLFRIECVRVRFDDYQIAYCIYLTVPQVGEGLKTRVSWPHMSSSICRHKPRVPVPLDYLIVTGEKQRRKKQNQSAVTASVQD